MRRSLPPAGWATPPRDAWSSETHLDPAAGSEEFGRSTTGCAGAVGRAPSRCAAAPACGGRATPRPPATDPLPAPPPSRLDPANPLPRPAPPHAEVLWSRAAAPTRSPAARARSDGLFPEPSPGLRASRTGDIERAAGRCRPPPPAALPFSSAEAVGGRFRMAGRKSAAAAGETDTGWPGGGGGRLVTGVVVTAPLPLGATGAGAPAETEPSGKPPARRRRVWSRLASLLASMSAARNFSMWGRRRAATSVPPPGVAPRSAALMSIVPSSASASSRRQTRARGEAPIQSWVLTATCEQGHSTQAPDPPAGSDGEHHGPRLTPGATAVSPAAARSQHKACRLSCSDRRRSRASVSHSLFSSRTSHRTASTCSSGRSLPTGILDCGRESAGVVLPAAAGLALFGATEDSSEAVQALFFFFLGWRQQLARHRRRKDGGGRPAVRARAPEPDARDPATVAARRPRRRHARPRRRLALTGAAAVLGGCGGDRRVQASRTQGGGLVGTAAGGAVHDARQPH
eukprot:scaffold19146_cov85-Isochrysis_galbana.AAC.2